MSCCGRSRAQFTRASSPPAPVKPAAFNLAAPLAVQQVGAMTLEYTGRTRLTVIGPVTRRRYDFVGHGARLQVDRRDSNAIAGMAGLRRV